MKNKFLALSLCAVLGLTTFALCGCTQESKTYEIFVTSSNLSQGGSAYGTGSYKENSTATLTATPKNDSAFLAWVKDNEKIVSYNKEYSFVVTSQTSGKYTALFDNATYEFVKLSNMTYSLSSYKLLEEYEDYQTTIKSWALSYNTKATSYKALGSFSDEVLENNSDNDFEEIVCQDNLFYLDNTYNFQLEINLEYVNETTQNIKTEPLITRFSVNFSNIFNSSNTVENNNFVKTTTYKNDKYSLILEETDEDNYTLTLNYFDLLSSTIWDNTDTVDPDNVQTLSLTFAYPITQNS